MGEHLDIPSVILWHLAHEGSAFLTNRRGSIYLYINISLGICSFFFFFFFGFMSPDGLGSYSNKRALNSGFFEERQQIEFK